MSRPSATSPGGLRKANCLSSKAWRTEGIAAIAEAAAPAVSMRNSSVASTPLTTTRVSPPSPGSRKVILMPCAQRVTASASDRSSPAMAAAYPTARYRAPESSRCQPSFSATARAIVPLPEPEGPSRVRTEMPDFIAMSCDRLACISYSCSRLTCHDDAHAAATRQYGESRKRSAHVGAIMDVYRRARDGPRDRESHGATMIAACIHFPAMQDAALDCGAVHRLLRADAQRAQARQHHGNAIGFLHAQLRGTVDHGDALRTGRRHEQDREFVDHVGHVFHRHFDTAQRCVAHLEIGDVLTTGFARVLLDDICAHRAQHAQQPGATRIQADAPQAQARPGNQRG